MWEGGQQPLKKRHFSKTLDSPSVRACLLLAAANCRREGFVPVLDALRGSRGLLALGVSPCGWGPPGCRGRDRQPWSPERPWCCRQQVRDLRQLRDPAPGTLPPAPPPLLLEDEAREGSSMEK